MMTLSRWLAPAALAVGLSVGALAAMPAHAQDNTWTRVLVDAADVALRGGQPYYRYGHYRDDDRLIVVRDRYGRPAYYRLVRADRGRDPYYAGNPYYGNPYYGGTYRNPAYVNTSTARRVTCSHSGNCTVQYYDPNYDRRGYATRYDRGHRGGYRHHGRDHDRDNDDDQD